MGLKRASRRKLEELNNPERQVGHLRNFIKKHAERAGVDIDVAWLDYSRRVSDLVTRANQRYGFTGETWAAASGVPLTFFRGMERGQVYSVKALVWMARVLGFEMRSRLLIPDPAYRVPDLRAIGAKRGMQGPINELLDMARTPTGILPREWDEQKAEQHRCGTCGAVCQKPMPLNTPVEAFWEKLRTERPRQLYEAIGSDAASAAGSTSSASTASAGGPAGGDDGGGSSRSENGT